MSRPRKQTLQLKRVGIDTYRENVAYLHRGCSVYRSEGFQALSKVEIKCNGSGSQKVLAVLNVVDDDSITGVDELGLCEQAFEQLGLREGQSVLVGHAEPPPSLDAVHRKIAGERLSAEDFQFIARDIAQKRYSKMEMAAFLVGSSHAGLERDEVLHFTQAMAACGKQLDWGESLVADKHCIGGIPGNRTSMLLVPIISAHGMLIPKTSSRAITSPAGTADTMELLANVELTPDCLLQIVRHHRGCLAWGGTAGLAPVDDILISVERPLSLDSPGQMVASILAKKLAAGSTHLLIDIPVGNTAKVRNMREALALRKLFEFVGDRLRLHLEVVISNGDQPVGRGIGPVLELRDVLQVLENDPEAPADLRQKSLWLAGRILEFDPDVRGGQGYAIARDILESGRALAKMQAIRNAQGATTEIPKPGHLQYVAEASADGVITAIDNLQIARIARLAGAPLDKGAGVDLYKKLGERVTAGDPLYRVHANFSADFGFAKELAQKNTGISIGPSTSLPDPLLDSEY